MSERPSEAISYFCSNVNPSIVPLLLGLLPTGSPYSYLVSEFSPDPPSLSLHVPMKGSSFLNRFPKPGFSRTCTRICWRVRPESEILPSSCSFSSPDLGCLKGLCAVARAFITQTEWDILAREKEEYIQCSQKELWVTSPGVLPLAIFKSRQKTNPLGQKTKFNKVLSESQGQNSAWWKETEGNGCDIWSETSEGCVLLCSVRDAVGWVRLGFSSASVLLGEIYPLEV